MPWAPATPGFSQSRVVGTWSGAMDQNVGSSGYALVLTLTNKGGETSYPALNCKGSWTRAGAAGDYIFFSEKVTVGRQDQGGRCIDGTFTIARAAAQLAVSWFSSFQGKALIGYGVLQRPTNP